MVDSGMRSQRRRGVGCRRSEDLDLDLGSSTSARRVVYDGRLLNAAAGAVMRMRTWMQCGVTFRFSVRGGTAA